MSRPTQGPLLALPVRGYHPLWPDLSRRFRLSKQGHWPGPRSLATTSGVSVDVLSSGYLDVSVRRVRLLHLCIQFRITLRWGFPIRKSTDQSLLSAPRSLSQSATSFIASQCQGIHEMPLITLDLHTQGLNPTRLLLFITHDSLAPLNTSENPQRPTALILSDQKNLFTMRNSVCHKRRRLVFAAGKRTSSIITALIFRSLPANGGAR